MKPEKKNNSDEKSKRMGITRKDGYVLSAGMMIFVCFLLCGGVGYFIDKHFHTGDKYTVVGSLFGLFCGIYNFVKIIIEAMHDNK